MTWEGIRTLVKHILSLDIMFRVCVDTHPLIADSWNNIGEVLRHMGSYDEALETHTKALEISTRIYGGDCHLSVASSFNNMANIYRAQGKYDQALELHAKSLEIRTATEMYTRAYHINLKVLGPDHPNT